MVIKFNNELHSVFSVTQPTPGNLRGFVQARMRNLRSGNMAEHRFSSEGRVERAALGDGGSDGGRNGAGLEGARRCPNVTRPAKMETGLVAQAPPFITEGEKIRVNTAEGTYLERRA